MHVIGQLLIARKTLNYDEFDFIKRGQDQGGYEWLLGKLPAELENSLDERLAIIVDADAKPADRLSQVINCAQQQGATIAAELNGTGAIGWAPNGQPLGVWIMPNHRDEGVLKNAFASLLDADPLWPKAIEAATEFAQPWRFKPQHKIKADVHTWLAWQEDPGRPMGVSIKTNPSGATSPQVDAFVSFVESLLKLNRR